VRTGQLLAIAGGALAIITLLLCCRSESVPKSGVDEARQLVDSTMLQWMSGLSISDLKSQSPPIYVIDDAWIGGSQLTAFEIQGPGEMYGPSVRLNVALSLSDGTKPSTQTVTYLVTTVPAQTIVRADR
jgi:hypothetical protein